MDNRLVVDFLRDTPEEIKAKIPIHYAQAQLAKVDKQDKGALFIIKGTEHTEEFAKEVKIEEAKREERERILLIIQDWDKWVNEEDGEEKWRAKYGCDTTELVKVIEQALKGEGK
ncbi:hypothetical protein LCGC14_1391860 [marine sediment metagenome]|uniref:Uncharacterized protein n=1 Tax=marine sediment metagenome TaxID=412755 RepID=A0A0F9K000_9ZZZZ